ncbi:MAG: hypothetical protein UZ20_WS6002000889 [candidate division WS6 bacterium OLB21]|nr:MAG: hypothetical protein UZ20_WS6002000889 [candidate division WS6 bacterium OLB21]
MGLVTSEFWLCCKTDRVISEVGTVGEEMLMRITEEAYSGNSFLNDVIRTEMKNWGLIFYRGEFNGKLIRI